MDTLWRTHTFSVTDAGVFKVPKSRQIPASKILYRNENDDKPDEVPDGIKLFDSPSDWQTWITGKASLFELNGKGRAMGVLMFSPPPDEVEALKLKCLPVDHNLFRLIADKFRFHRALAEILENGSAAFSRIPCEIEKRQCNVYTLHVDPKMSKHTAITISHFPETELQGSKTYALMLGFELDDMDEVSQSLKSYERLHPSGDHLFSPFTLVKIFLELEKRKRFDAVAENVANINNAVEGSQWQASANTNYIDSHHLVQLYLKVSFVKLGLAMWKDQLLGMKEHIPEFRSTISPREIDPGDYLSRLIDEYGAAIEKCNAVLLTTSLTFQRNIAQLAKEDARQMKAIAVLTMIFLPGTFIAILMAVPEFDAMKNIKAIPEWSWYLILSLPLTAIVFAIYLVYVYFTRTKNTDQIS